MSAVDDGDGGPVSVTGEIAAFREGPAEDAIDAALQRGVRAFMGVELFVASGALVPRTETELLGRVAAAHLDALARERGPREPILVVDMCCGSGNLACALASRTPGARVWAADLTEPCIALARRNVDKLGLAGRVEVLQGDLFAPLAPLGLAGRVDVIVCNPPYISSTRLAERFDLLAREPREAFDGGPYGLTIHQRVIRDAARFLRPGGWLAVELGAGQARQASLLFGRARAYDEPILANDAAGEPRVAAAFRRMEP